MTNEPDTRVRLTTRRLPGHTLIALGGELDVATTAAVRDRIMHTLADAAGPVIIDLSEVVFADTSGLALLVGAQRRAEDGGFGLVLAGPPPRVRALLRLTGLDEGFIIHATAAEAAAAAPAAL
ncbi:STAS domain-containing protein [Allonocardiopsis opalescens]|uniref:Anti-sigma factor antagonist n=1 Tax=Allonocardiopsis opalescens TaxID=1144618 RepID=A0A2T0QA94_9ACTN|nr:STAS domain-containing protein [Allonocardiopsis opalescens]PRY00740.1 anti-sigma B factor antagonist [Allonocardiopsis opalescens]